MSGQRWKKSFLLVFWLIFIILIAASCGGRTEKVAEQGKKAENAAVTRQYTIKFVGTLPMSHHCTKAMELFKEEVEKNSKGQIKVELYPAQQLYNDKDLVNALPKGAIEMAALQPDFWAGLVPSPSLLYLPLLYEDLDHYYRTIDSPVAEIINKDFEEKANVKILAIYNYGGLGIISKKPVQKLEDFKGLRVRSPGKYYAVTNLALGAAPVNLSSGEVYQALQKGTIDAAIAGPSSLVPRKWHELAKNFFLPFIVHVHPYPLGVHLDFWNSLSPDLQKVLKDAAKKSADYTKAEAEKDTNNGLAEMRKAGVIIYELPKEEYTRWKKAVLPKLTEEFGKDVGKEKAQKMIDEVEKLRKK